MRRRTNKLLLNQSNSAADGTRSPLKTRNQRPDASESLTKADPWYPSFGLAFAGFATARLLAASYSFITDCDEVFNYWEPMHYMQYGYGLQTWEYSPEYSIRSWAYILLHSAVLVPVKYLMEFFVVVDKIRLFYTMRTIFAIACAYCEARFYKSVLDQFGCYVARFLFVGLLFAPGMWNASTAFLPSSFAMYTTMMAFTHSFGSIKTDFSKRNIPAIFWFGLGGLLAWPFSAAIGIPSVLKELVLHPEETMNNKQTHSASTLLWRINKISIAVLHAFVWILVPVIAIDYYLYKKLTIVPLNIILYNIFGGDRGPSLYGVEPWHFYILNGVLNFSLLFPIALLSLPTLMLSYSVGIGHISFRNKVSYPGYSDMLGYLFPLYLWLVIFMLQPHKEERFLYVVYPLVCFNAAIALSLLQGLFYKALELRYGAFITQRHCWLIISAVTSALIATFCVLSVLRIYGQYQYYHAPLNVYKHFYQVEIPQHMQAKNLTLNLDHPINLCVGKEWYRFPSHYFLPEGVRLRFLKSEFRGLLPKYFLEDKPRDGKEITMWRHQHPGTWQVQSGFNDHNEEDSSCYINIEDCKYIIDFSSNAIQPSPLEPEYIQLDTWTSVYCEPFLDKKGTRGLGRVLWIPSWLKSIPLLGKIIHWLDTSSPHWGMYCILKRSEFL